MKRLTVELPGKSYDLLLGAGLRSEPEKWLSASIRSGRSVAVVSDENVWQYYGDDFQRQVNRIGLKAEAIILRPGEDNKSLAGLNRLYEFFADINLNRSGLVIALGGGVIGDLTGFAAATWMRGVEYIQFPTTLLSQVDSSVGGKTALNLPSGKNIIGAFHQPKLVVIDPDTLRTLPRREINCGLGEVIKYGAIRSSFLFEKLEQGQADDYEAIISECCAIKAGIVANDEFDAGERALLNFGHSFGHALESFYQYQRFNHGEAVALGMIIASALGEQMGLTEPGTGRRIIKALKINGFETSLPCSPLDLMPLLKHDKKSEGDGLRLALLNKIGDALIKPIRFLELENLLRQVEEQWTIRF